MNYEFKPIFKPTHCLIIIKVIIHSKLFILLVPIKTIVHMVIIIPLLFLNVELLFVILYSSHVVYRRLLDLLKSETNTHSIQSRVISGRTAARQMRVLTSRFLGIRFAVLFAMPFSIHTE